jgi:hypothetical protein
MKPLTGAAMLLMIHELPHYCDVVQESRLPLNAYSLIRLAQESAG